MNQELQPLTKREQAIGFLMTMLTPLCEFPKELKIEDRIDERGLVLNVLASPKDLPFLIGRSGKIANSLRDVLHIFGARQKISCKLFINQRNASDPKPN